MYRRHITLFVLLLTAGWSVVLPGQGSASAPITWQVLDAGLEFGIFFPSGVAQTDIWMVRIDPVHFEMQAHYLPGLPLRREDWSALLPCASVIVNANFFDAHGLARGLVIVGGVEYGRSFESYGGSVEIDLWGNVRVRMLAERLDSPLTLPYHGVQGYPVLVHGGLASVITTGSDEAARRTAVAQDRDGRLLLIATPAQGIGLNELASALIDFDLGIETAVNLDGGTSTLLHVRSTRQAAIMADSVHPVPAVLAFYPRRGSECDVS
ncbi:MAG: phosphodiester glycosidase family protein [bacterium]|nr:phosphodiester glycosidase family protein [bacterium]